MSGVARALHGTHIPHAQPIPSQCGRARHWSFGCPVWLVCALRLSTEPARERAAKRRTNERTYACTVGNRGPRKGQSGTHDPMANVPAWVLWVRYDPVEHDAEPSPNPAAKATLAAPSRAIASNGDPDVGTSFSCRQCVREEYKRHEQSNQISS